jgi:hypothetical protein
MPSSRSRRSADSRRSSTSRPGRTAVKVVLGMLLTLGVFGVAVTGAAVWQQYNAPPPTGTADPELAALKIACEAQLKGGGAPGSVVANQGAQTAAAPAQLPAKGASDSKMIGREETDILADAEADYKAAEAEENGDDTVYSKHTADQHWMQDYASSVRKSAAAQDDCARYFQKMREHGKGIVKASATAPHPHS